MPQCVDTTHQDIDAINIPLEEHEVAIAANVDNVDNTVVSVQADYTGAVSYTLEDGNTIVAYKGSTIMDYTATDGQIEFIIPGLYSLFEVHREGVLLRSTEFTLSDDGTNTTIELPPQPLNTWIKIKGL